eukprot:TRINITY_DN16815_c0_g1_i1.p1 TRINITY_DN16815_c0_g1~~TRINITY_DN16815_c0_g1_i1.p1  ORF type:complete len:459 (-),score=138.07 TRINITY_DN16815_c0_g1_i1:61-1437(-)
MAPAPKIASTMDLKENNVPGPSKLAGKDGKVAVAKAKPLNGFGFGSKIPSKESSTIQTSPRLQKAKSEGQAPAAAEKTRQATTPRRVRPSPTAPQRTTTPTAASRIARPGTATAKSRRPVDPWAEVRAITAEADKLEAELEKLNGEFEDAEREALEAEALEQEAENALTAKSAEMLAEYAAAHDRCMKLEEDLKSSRQKLDQRRKENLELSRRNIELDREMKSLKEEIEEAKDVLEKCTSSQGTLDEKIAERLDACDKLREAAKVQCERLHGDLRRFSTMKERLTELGGKEEAQQLIIEANEMIEKTKVVLAECEEVVEKGIVPDEVPEPCEEASKEFAEEAANANEESISEEEVQDPKESASAADEEDLEQEEEEMTILVNRAAIDQDVHLRALREEEEDRMLESEPFFRDRLAGGRSTRCSVSSTHSLGTDPTLSAEMMQGLLAQANAQRSGAIPR